MARGRSKSTSSAGSTSSRGGTPTAAATTGRGARRGRSTSRDYDSEFSDKFGDDPSAFAEAIANSGLDAPRYIAPSTAAVQKRILGHFVAFLAATLRQYSTREQRLAEAWKLTQRGRPLPTVEIVVAFLKFWAEGAQGRLSDDGRIASSTFEHTARTVVAALSRTHLKQYSKEQSTRIHDWVYNASRGPDAIVKRISKEKKIVSYADLERIMFFLFDRRSGPYGSKMRTSLQVAMIVLLLWAFGIRPASAFLHRDYVDVPGEPQTLLWKDVDIRYEGIGPEGDATFNVRITFRWCKGMREHASENLIVRVRSLPRAKAHLDPINYLLALGIYRGVFEEDARGIIDKPNRATVPETAIPIRIKTAARLWPVFVSPLDGSTERPKKRKAADSASGSDVDNAPSNSKARGAPAKKKQTFKASALASTSSSKESGEDVARDATVETWKAVKDIIAVDYSQPALDHWLNKAMSILKQSLGYPSLTPYDFRRSFAMNMRSWVSKEDLQYLMGHRPGSKMTDTRYQSTERQHDVTSERFGVDKEAVPASRNSIGWNLPPAELNSTWDRINLLAKQVQAAIALLEARFESLDVALNSHMEDSDVEALLDLQSLLLGELSKMPGGWKPSALGPASGPSEGAPAEASTSSSRKLAQAATSGQARSGAAGLFDAFDFDDNFVIDPDLIDLPDSLTRLDKSSSETASKSTMDTEAATSPAAGPSLSSQIKEALNQAQASSEHPLATATRGAPSGAARAVAVDFILDLLCEQDLYEMELCKLCVKDGITKPWSANLAVHAYRCENDHLKETHVRCAICAAMVPISDTSAACAHLLACSQEWASARSQAPSLTVTSRQEQDDVDSLAGAQDESTTEREATLQLPSTQLSRISEKSEEENVAPQTAVLPTQAATTPAASEAAVSAAAAAAPESGADFKVLLEPLAPAVATFYFTEFTRGITRCICPKCLKEAEADWERGEATLLQPEGSVSGFCQHFLTHFGPEAALDWDKVSSCDMPGCSFSGKLQTLLPHYAKVHSLNYLRVGYRSQRQVVLSALPADLGGPLPFLDDLDPEDDTSLYVRNLRRESRNKRKKQKDEQSKGKSTVEHATPEDAVMEE